MVPTETQEQEKSMQQVVRDLRAQLTSTQEELTALLKKQRQRQVGMDKRQQDTPFMDCLGTWDAHGAHRPKFWWFLTTGSQS